MHKIKNERGEKVKSKSIMRCMLLALPMILLISLILINPVKIYADVGGGISPRFDPILIVGQVDDLAHTGIGAITESDAQTGCDIRITKVSLIPSCGALGPGVCTSPDPGVITIHDANGVLIAAEGIAFNAQCTGIGVPFGCCGGAGTGNCNGCVGSQWTAQLTNAALGLYEFTPTANVILVAPNDTTPPPGCVLSFGIDVIKLPTIDSIPATPVLDTSRIAFWEGLTLNCPNSGGNSFPASGTGTGASTVTAPDFSVTKTGPEKSKVGDEVTYNYSITNTNGLALNLVSVSDDKIGDLTATANAAGCNVLSLSETCNFTSNYTVQQSDPDPLVNTVTVTYNVPGTAINIVHTDTHSVNLFQPAIIVAKTCDEVSKVGDTVNYTITLSNNSSVDTPALNCTAVDSLLGTVFSGVLPLGNTVLNKTRVVQAGDLDPLVNTVTLTCSPEGFPNVLKASAGCETVLLTPSCSISKTCSPNPLVLGGPITWTITLNNTGEGDLNICVEDSVAGISTCELVPAQSSATVSKSRTVTAADCPEITNTATATATVVGLGNEISCGQATDTCTCPEFVEEICRTPGFWGTHACPETIPGEIESSVCEIECNEEGTVCNCAQNITQAVIDHCGGCLNVCGEIITNTALKNADSAVEATCVRPSGNIRLQLARQLTATALNCCVSGGGNNCSDVSIEETFNLCNEACAESSQLKGAIMVTLSSGATINCIKAIDCFNNGGTYQPATNETPASCEKLPDNCHEQEIPLEALGLTNCVAEDGVTLRQGSAGSSKECNTAKNSTYCAVLAKPFNNGCGAKVEVNNGMVLIQGEECCKSNGQPQGLQQDVELCGGCGQADACGDKAPAGCFCDLECCNSADCCPDAEEACGIICD